MNNSLNKNISSLKRQLAAALQVACMLAPCLLAMNVRAQEAAPAATGGLDEIVVTARRKEENQQTVPVTVDSIKPETLEARGNVSVLDLQELVPGLMANSDISRDDVTFSIRGQTQTGGTLFPAVITYFSEVPLGSVSSGEFYDLENIQVLKGPQGTLFGRVTDGGAILLTPVKPAMKFEGYGELKLGDYNLREFRGAVSLPIVDDKVALRIAADVSRRDGYTHNLFDGSFLDDVSYEGGRIGLLLKPIDSLTNYTIFSYHSMNENGGGAVSGGFNPSDFSPDTAAQMLANYQQQLAYGPRTVNQGNTGPLFHGNGTFYQRESTWLVNTTTYQLLDNLSIKNIFGHTYDKENHGQTYTAPPYPIFANTGRFAPVAWSEQYSDELQLQGSAFDRILSYTTGVYFDYQQTPGFEETGAILNQGANLQVYVDSKTQTRDSAAYGQLSFDLSKFVPGLQFDAGVRYSKDKIESNNAEYLSIGLDPTPVPHGQCLTTQQVIDSGLAAQGVLPVQGCTKIDGSSSATTYTFDLNYLVFDKTFVYASLRRGYRPGGVNQSSASGSLVLPTYGPEFDLSHEFGIKSDWAIGDVKIRTNLAAYWDEGTQIQQSVLAETPNNTPVTGIVNSADSTIRGIEFQGTAIPIEGLTLNANWAYASGYYHTSHYTPEEIAASCPANPATTPAGATGRLCPLQAINNLPRNVVDAAAHYTLPLGSDLGAVTVGGDWFYTSSYATYNSRLPVTPIAPFGPYLPSYSLVNFDASWRNILRSSWDARVFVTNAANKEYIQGAASYLNASSLGIQELFYGAPRMYGVAVKYRFGQER